MARKAPHQSCFQNKVNYTILYTPPTGAGARWAGTVLQRRRLRVGEAKESAQGAESAWRYHPVTRRHRRAAHTRQECADLHILERCARLPFSHYFQTKTRPPSNPAHSRPCTRAPLNPTRPRVERINRLTTSSTSPCTASSLVKHIENRFFGKTTYPRIANVFSTALPPDCGPIRTGRNRVRSAWSPTLSRRVQLSPRRPVQ